eukprot:820964-Amorphochlora_amoeboformis.AAC.2
MATFQIHDDFTTASEVIRLAFWLEKVKFGRSGQSTLDLPNTGLILSAMDQRHSISSIHHSAGISKKKSRRNKRVSFGGNRIREFNELYCTLSGPYGRIPDSSLQ